MDGKSMWIVKRSFSLPQRSTEDNFPAVNWIDFGLNTKCCSQQLHVHHTVHPLNSLSVHFGRYTICQKVDLWIVEGETHCPGVHILTFQFLDLQGLRKIWLGGNIVHVPTGRSNRQSNVYYKYERCECWWCHFKMCLTAHQRPSKTNTYTVVQNQQAQLIDS